MDVFTCPARGNGRAWRARHGGRALGFGLMCKWRLREEVEDTLRFGLWTFECDGPHGRGLGVFEDQRRAFLTGILVLLPMMRREGRKRGLEEAGRSQYIRHSISLGGGRGGGEGGLPSWAG